MRNPKFVTGNVATGEDYFFRLGYEEEVWDLLESDHLLLLSPRRTGKTSLMRYMQENPRLPYRVFYLNVEDLNSPENFYLSLLDAIDTEDSELWRAISSLSWIKNSLSGIDEVSIAGAKIKLRDNIDWTKHWKEHAESLMQKLMELDEKVLFIIDELPDMLNKMADDHPDAFEVFLSHFRVLRTDKKYQNNIRWLVGGSINLNGVLQDKRLLNKVNDFRDESLPEITAQEFQDFVKTMLNQFKLAFADDIIDKIKELVGMTSPYFLQLFVQEITRYARRNRVSKIEISDVEEVFRTQLLGGAAKSKLQHFHSRITSYYPHHLHQATYRLLTELAKADSVSENTIKTLFIQETQGQDLETDTVFNSLIARLENDFYIDQTLEGKYRFSNRLLKLWWNKFWVR